MEMVMNKRIEYEKVCNLSFEDISVMTYAQVHKYRLLTGDKVLRDKATLENIMVSGILYLTDKMVENRIIEPSVMANALENMLESNARLPKKIIKERIEKYRA